MSIKRECIKAGFVVTMRQYGEFVGHELFLRRSELLEELDNYREAKFTSLEIVGIRHLGSYLSPGAMAVVLDQVTWHRTAIPHGIRAMRQDEGLFTGQGPTRRAGQQFSFARTDAEPERASVGLPGSRAFRGAVARSPASLRVRVGSYANKRRSR
jgi:hypothetical protein